jgi:hypothetical protein
MNLDWKVVANAPWIWICGAIICAIALYQCTFFMVKALKIMSRSGLGRKEIGGIVRGAAITSIGPVMAEIFVMVGLVMALSAGFAWQREGAAVGSVTTELVQAANAAKGAGQEFGSKDNFDMTGFANVVFVMNVSCIGWLIVAGLFTPYLGVARHKIAGGDSNWLSILTVCATLGVFGYWASTYLVKMGNSLVKKDDPTDAPFGGVATIAGALLAVFFYKLADWIKMPRLKEWSLGIAMFGGMVIGKLAAG